MKRRPFAALALAVLLSSCSSPEIATRTAVPTAETEPVLTVETAPEFVLPEPPAPPEAEPDIVHTKAELSIRAVPEEDAEIVFQVKKGASLTRTERGENGWDTVVTEDGTAGFVRHAEVSLEPIPKAGMKVTITSFTAPEERASEYPDGWLEQFNEKILELQVQFPKGTYWNHTSFAAVCGVTNTPCDHSLEFEEKTIWCNTYSGITKTAFPQYDRVYQCLAFASMLSDSVFGIDAPLIRFSDYDRLQIGDQARINGNSHSVFILDKTDEYVIVAECNADYQTCVINWGRKIPRSAMNGFYLTRRG